MVFSEAKERLNASNNSYDSLIGKANVLLGFLVTLWSGLVAYFGKDLGTPAEKLQFLPTLLFSCFAAWSLCCLLRIVKKANTSPSGYCPEKLFQNAIMQQEHKEFVFRLIKQYAIKIDHNEDINTEKGKLLSSATSALITGLTVFALSYLYLSSLGTFSSIPVGSGIFTSSTSSSETVRSRVSSGSGGSLSSLR